MKRTILILAAASALALTGCSTPAASPGVTGQPQASSATASATPTAAALPSGKFELKTESGAKIVFALPTPANHPDLAAIEGFRTETGGKPVSYIVADVDNRNGTELVNMYQISAFDADGIQYTFSTVTDALKSWGPNYGSDYIYRMPDGKVVDDATGSALARKATELNNANINGADPAERTTIILASTYADLPKEFTKVSVQPSGGGTGEDATPASE